MKKFLLIAVLSVACSRMHDCTTDSVCVEQANATADGLEQAALWALDPETAHALSVKADEWREESAQTEHGDE